MCYKIKEENQTTDSIEYTDNSNIVYKYMPFMLVFDTANTCDMENKRSTRKPKLEHLKIRVPYIL